MSQEPRSAAVPRLIHQIWYQGADALPNHYRAYAVGWKSKHPGWEYRLWDHATCRALLAERYPDFLDIWERYPMCIQRLDSIRYFILHTYGGIYIDMDMECLKPLEPLFEGCDLLLSRTVQYNIAVMASRPGHELWEHVFCGLVVASQRPRPRGVARWWGGQACYVAETSGPRFFTRMIQETGADARAGTRVCPGYVFEPYTPTLRHGRLTFDNDTSRSHAIHHEALSWVPPAHRYVSFTTRRLLRLILALGRGASHE